MALEFSIQEHLLPGMSLSEKWDAAQRMGCTGIELRGEGGPAFHARLPGLKAARRAGATFPTVCVIMDRFIGDFAPDRRAEALASMKTLLSVISELNGTGAITPASYGMHSSYLPPFEAPRTSEQDRAVLIDLLGQLGDHAAGEGVLVLLEPLNRYEDHMLNRLAQGSDILKALGHPAVKLMADLFHMNIEEADLAAALEDSIDDVAHVHVADSNRLEPGRGHTDFAAAFAVLNGHGFSGHCALECRLSGPPLDVLPPAMAILREAAGSRPATAPGGNAATI